MQRPALFLVVLSLSLSALAADKGPALPNAPSASSADDKQTASAGTQNATEDAVLKKRSVFFPDLAADRTPLTVGQKFGLFAKKSISPGAIAGSAFSAGINQATDSPSGYGQGAEGYGKRFGAAMATEASTNFFATFALASIAHQDPRYFVRGSGTFGQRTGHAISRIVVAPNDGGGYGFNWGGVFGPLAAETLANTYQPVREQTGARTLTRYGTDIAARAGINVLKEFWPDISRRLGLRKLDVHK